LRPENREPGLLCLTADLFVVGLFCFCRNPLSSVWRWFTDYQAMRGPYDSNAIAACEANAQWDKENL
jgi:hypothetical protein